ncbi:MAG TPA: efflux RND transporter periplasmic adaptor subunit [Rhodanobacter sp.]|jgi:cobalt-zinc-cadmium efflux system membrane fusion protein|nr:efflux RND transporter periplasmic adaptor subunit [Rhodanobacter sp.]
MNTNTHKKLRSAAILLALAWLLAGCSHGEQATESAPAFIRDNKLLRVPADSPLRKRLIIQTVELRQVPHQLTVPATVEADPTHVANVLSPLTGKLVELHVGLGDHVSRGQLLAVIESGDLAQAYADVDKAREALELARKTLERSRGVAQAGGAAVKDLEAAQNGQAQAQAEFNRAQTRLAAVGGNQQARTGARQMRVIAPISGTVTALSVAQGVFVNDPASALMTIANLESVWISANVPENELGPIARGQPMDASLPAYPGQIFHGTVSFVSAMLDPDTRRDKVRTTMANPDGKLKPNMFANATFDIPQPAQVFVPESALLMNNDDTTVFVEMSPWTFERRTVELSYDETAGARVLKGLTAGDRVIVKGGVLLND